MKRRVLIIVASDPARSSRPAEGLRIAASLASWKRVEVSLCLWAAGAAALGDDADLFERGDELTRWLATVRDSGAPIYAEMGARRPARAITAEQLGRLAAKHSCVMHF